MARPIANLRLFAAIYPPPQTARDLLDAMARLSLPPHRPAPLEQVHMTVQFIGDTPAADLDATMESVQRAVAGLGSFWLAPLRLMVLPERGPARLVAVETDLPAALLEIHRRLVTRLARKPRDRDVERFRPHLTLTRFRSPARGVVIDQSLTLPAFGVQRLVLMRSTLLPQGAKHEELIACALG